MVPSGSRRQCFERWTVECTRVEDDQFDSCSLVEGCRYNRLAMHYLQIVGQVTRVNKKCQNVKKDRTSCPVSPTKPKKKNCYVRSVLTYRLWVTYQTSELSCICCTASLSAWRQSLLLATPNSPKKARALFSLSQKVNASNVEFPIGGLKHVALVPLLPSS